MKKAVGIFCLACLAIVFAACVAGGNKTMAQDEIAAPSPAISAQKNLVFVDGEDAEPPAWPQMHEWHPKAKESAPVAQVHEMKTAALPPKAPPRLPGKDKTIARMPSGEVFTIIWAR